MWNDLIILASVTIGVVGIVFLVKYLKNKSLFDKDGLQNTQKILEIVELVFNVVNKDEKLKNKATFVFDLARIVVEYVDKIMDENIDQEVVALEVVKQLLDKFGVTPTNDEWRLIEIIIREGLALQRKQDK